MRVTDTVLKPRDGHTVRAGIIARISGCKNQKEASLDDQLDHEQEVVREHYDGEIDFEVIAKTKAKGEWTDRPELAAFEEIARRGDKDIIVIEDLGRLVRGTEAVRLLGIAVDNKTRVIVPNDNIDTSRDTWEQDAIRAAADHVAHNAHTSHRLKHKLRNRFVKFGGAMARPIAGYIVPDEATTYSDWRKDPNAAEWILNGYQLLRRTQNYSAVADMLNRKGVPTGPYCRNLEWDGAMAKRFYRNPLLKGRPYRNKMHSVKHYQTGRRKSVKHPDGPVFFDAPHLAFLDATDFDDLGALLDAKNANFRRRESNGVDPLLGVPRRRSKFPGQILACYYCGHKYVWGGNGITSNLMCANSRHWRCWNTDGVRADLVTIGLRDAILAELYRLDGFDDQYRDLLERADAGCGLDYETKVAQIESQAAEVERQERNLINAIRKYGDSEPIQSEMEALKARKATITESRRELKRSKESNLKLPSSVSELRKLLEEQFLAASQSKDEFGDLLRKICPEMHAYLVATCDGQPSVYPRVQARIELDGIVDNHTSVNGLDKLLHRVITIDAFVPPQRERIRLRAVAGREQGLTIKAIVRHIAAHSSDKPSACTVSAALRLHDAMQRQSLSSPYVLAEHPPADQKHRRHKNAKYSFQLRNGYVPPELL